MEFHPIDRDTWDRAERFEHYFSQVPCFYSMTVDLDVTELKRRGGRFYPAVLYSLAVIVNRHREFRMAFNEEGVLGWYDQLSPSYTVFHPDTESFSCLWTEYTPDPSAFLQRYEEDLRLYGSVESFEAKPHTPPNVFNVSMIPWQVFTSFHLELPRGGEYLLPIFTLGRYRPVQGRLLMPLALQVHHAVCDGFHACRFVEELQLLLNLGKAG